MRNLNPDFGASINNGLRSIVQLLSRFSVPTRAEQSVVFMPAYESVLLVSKESEDSHSQEILIYNIGQGEVAICLGQPLASFEKRNYSLGSGVLVSESFSGVISGISQEAGQVIVTVKK